MDSERPPQRQTGSTVPRRVLFLCIGNSARSQLAEALARSMAPAGTEVWSAGTAPKQLHPMAVVVMREAGIDIGQQRAKALDAVPWREADTVVTLCGEADEACPALAAGVRRLHWPLPDPAQAKEKDQLAAFREARDEIRWRVASLWPGGD